MKRTKLSIYLPVYLSVALAILFTTSCALTGLRQPQSDASSQEAPTPPSCFAYAQKTSFSRLSAQDSRFGSCSDKKTQLTRGAMAIAADPNWLSESFTNLSQCLGISNAKKIFPQFAGESGFYANAFGRAGEIGIGQLSADAITDVTRALPTFRNQLQQSNKISCQKLAGQDSLWQPQLYKNSCAFINGNAGVERNLLYSLIYHKLIDSWISKDLEQLQIIELLSRLGLQESTQQQLTIFSWNLPATIYHREDLSGLLTSVAYNTGSKGIVTYLKNYLQKKQEATIHLTKNDFNFKNDLSWINALSKEQANQLAVQNLSFPAYLKIYQKAGHPGYGPDMMKQIYKFNNGVGPATCTPERIEGFLAL